MSFTLCMVMTPFELPTPMTLLSSCRAHGNHGSGESRCWQCAGKSDEEVCAYGETRERCATLAKVDNEPLADARADVGDSELGADQRQGERLVLYRAMSTRTECNSAL